MSRKGRIKARDIASDAKYGNFKLAKFINSLMWDGKKAVVESHVYEAMDKLAKKYGRDPIEVFTEALTNVSPTIEVRTRRIGGANYQVPTPVSSARSLSLALRWLKTSLSKISRKELSDKIVQVLTESLDKTGWAFKKREEVFKMAEANKVFAHYNNMYSKK